MTETETGFLDAICADPDDVGLRLIYADALEDAGDVDRAEFIQVQCALARPDPSHCYAECQQTLYGCPQCSKMKNLRRRERELLEGCNTTRFEEWFPIAGMGSAFQWTPLRGFVEVVSCACADWLAHGPTIVRAQPIREVKLTDLFRYLQSQEEIDFIPDGVRAPLRWARGPHEGLTALLTREVPHG